jgi:hypothetical protein
MTLSKSEISQLEKARTVGGDPSVSLSNGEMVNLLKIVTNDLDLNVPDQLTCDECNDKIQSGFFNIGINDLNCSALDSTFSIDDLLKRTIGDLAEDDPDIFTYYVLLVQLHSYRRKFEKYVVFRISRN